MSNNFSIKVDYFSGMKFQQIKLILNKFHSNRLLQLWTLFKVVIVVVKLIQTDYCTCGVTSSTEWSDVSFKACSWVQYFLESLSRLLLSEFLVAESRLIECWFTEFLLSELWFVEFLIREPVFLRCRETIEPLKSRLLPLNLILNLRPNSVWLSWKRIVVIIISNML